MEADFKLNGLEYYTELHTSNRTYYFVWDGKTEHEILHIVYKNAQLEHRLNELEQKLADIVHFNKLDDNSGL
jgi:hypothetical protein